MDRCVMRKMASAKTHSFFTLLFYLLHPSPCISVRLVIWMGIQWTTHIIREEDERGINNSTEARAKTKRASGTGNENQRERERLVERRSRFRGQRETGKKKRKQASHRHFSQKWEHDMRAARGKVLVVAEMSWGILGETHTVCRTALQEILVIFDYDERNVGVVRKFTAKVWSFMLYIKVIDTTVRVTLIRWCSIKTKKN